jgi:hypothetical protein
MIFFICKIVGHMHAWIFICKIVGECMILIFFIVELWYRTTPLTTKRIFQCTWLSKLSYKDYWIFGGITQIPPPIFSFGLDDMYDMYDMPKKDVSSGKWN